MQITIVCNCSSNDFVIMFSSESSKCRSLVKRKLFDNFPFFTQRRIGRFDLDNAEKFKLHLISFAAALLYFPFDYGIEQ